MNWLDDMPKRYSGYYMDENGIGDYSMPDFGLLNEVHKRCKELSVSWSMQYGEGEDNFYFIISSPAKEENYMTKDMDYKYALDSVIEFLKALKGDE